ncbi:hypothetical protein, partial [Enterobacter hormaechei]
ANGKQCIKKMNALHRNSAALQGAFARDNPIPPAFFFIFTVVWKGTLRKITKSSFITFRL